MDWDNPRQVLLSLVGLVESNMGGTSGAVSVKTFVTQIFTKFLGLSQML